MKQSKTSGDFCLSDKILFDRMLGIVLKEEDVKEFVRLLKVQIDISSLISRGVKNNLISKVRKLAGEKLTK